MKPLDPRLLRYARATVAHLAFAVVLGIVTALLVIAQADLLARGIAGVVEAGGRTAELTGILGWLALVVAARAAVAWARDAGAHRASARVKSQLRRQIVARAAAQAPGGGGPGRAEVATLATRGLDALDAYFGTYLPQLVLALIVPVAVLARLATADTTATVTVALTLPLIPVFMVLVGLATEAASRRRWRALERLSHHFLDVVAGLPTLKAFGRAKAQAEAIRRSTDRYRTTTMGTLRIAFLSSLVLELLATLSVALVAVGVGLRLVHGDLDLQTGLLVIVLAPEAYLPLRQVGASHHASAEGLAAAEAAFGVLDQPVPAPGGSTPVPDLQAGAEIWLDDVGVRHPGRAGLAPAGATFRAGVGEVVALAGPSGAGKSTLLRVLLGFTRPDTGRVLVPSPDGTVDLADVDPRAWRRQIGWVDQSPYLFAGAVADNVRLGDPEASDLRVGEALAAAGFDPHRAGHPVGESGAGLSAGERRRVALARALLRCPSLLLLDEPTAGLDEDTESDVLAAVRQAAARAAVVMVTHRPAALAVADRVVEIVPAAASEPVP
ncbi:MAG TPA: thiol reductant ABC exporter subunit CydD [Acidimicrobiales bacterium]|nr:thiol reductant ABC exporter subunit CydD [Acidimicrobiales bacterium]